MVWLGSSCRGWQGVGGWRGRGSPLLVLCGIFHSVAVRSIQQNSQNFLHVVFSVKLQRTGSCLTFLVPAFQSPRISPPCMLLINVVRGSSLDRCDRSFVSGGSSSRCMQAGQNYSGLSLENSCHSPPSAHNSHSSLTQNTARPFSQDHQSHPIMAST